MTYILLAHGFLYLIAPRRENALSLRERMISRTDYWTGRDQGSQFTSWDVTQKLKAAGIRISMDGKGRWLDNVFVERLWRSLKYECVYLHAWSGGRGARGEITAWMIFYNQQRPHAAHDGRTTDAHHYQIDAMPPDEMAA